MRNERSCACIQTVAETEAAGLLRGITTFRDLSPRQLPHSPSSPIQALTENPLQQPFADLRRITQTPRSVAVPASGSFRLMPAISGVGPFDAASSAIQAQNALLVPAWTGYRDSISHQMAIAGQATAK